MERQQIFHNDQLKYPIINSNKYLFVCLFWHNSLYMCLFIRNRFEQLIKLIDLIITLLNNYFTGSLVKQDGVLLVYLVGQLTSVQNPSKTRKPDYFSAVFCCVCIYIYIKSSKNEKCCLSKKKFFRSYFI